MVPPSRFHSDTNSACRAVPKASLRAPTLSFAPFPNFVSAAPTSTLLWSASDGYARNTRPLSLRSLICGALDVGETRRTLFGIVTDCAIGIVAPDAISPMITLALFTLMSFVAASTDADACVWPSSEPTIRTEALVSPALLSVAFWSRTACFTARSRFPPYAARSPVKGSTSPMRSWNAQFRGASDRESFAPVAVAATAARTAAAATATWIDLVSLVMHSSFGSQHAGTTDAGDHSRSGAVFLGCHSDGRLPLLGRGPRRRCRRGRSVDRPGASDARRTGRRPRARGRGRGAVRHPAGRHPPAVGHDAQLPARDRVARLVDDRRGAARRTGDSRIRLLRVPVRRAQRGSPRAAGRGGSPPECRRRAVARRLARGGGEARARPPDRVSGRSDVLRGGRVHGRTPGGDRRDRAAPRRPPRDGPRDRPGGPDVGARHDDGPLHRAVRRGRGRSRHACARGAPGCRPADRARAPTPVPQPAGPRAPARAARHRARAAVRGEAAPRRPCPGERPRCDG